MRGADADICRRAWLPCPRCGDHLDGAGCPHCRAGRTCDAHWRYLLAAEGRQLFLQCPACLHRWWDDTGFGAGDRPVGRTDVPGWPQRRAA